MAVVLSSFEERLEAENQALRNVNHLVQRWENRITARRLRIAKRFLDLELHIVLHLRVVESGKCWGVLLEKEIPIEPIGKENKIPRPRSDRTMFVDTVKLVNSPEIKVPAFVWFEEIESFYSLWPDTIYKSVSSGFVTSDALRNWESIPVRDFASSNDEHVTHQVIESGAQIVGDIASSSRNIRRTDDSLQEAVRAWNSLSDAEIIRRAFSFLSVSLSDDHCSALYSQDVGCQIVEVLFGPLNFYANENDSFVGAKQRTLLSNL
jgi:hypothetical protein